MCLQNQRVFRKEYVQGKWENLFKHLLLMSCRYLLKSTTQKEHLIVTELQILSNPTTQG